jgi:hypothetical protein
MIKLENLKLNSISLSAFELFLNSLNNVPKRNINFSENLKRCNIIKIIEQAIEEEKQFVDIEYNDFTFLLTVIDEMVINEISYELAGFWSILINKVKQ